MADGSKTTAGEPIVSQMSPKLRRAGHEYTPLATYIHELYAVVHFEMDKTDRQYLLDADDGCAFVRYGFAQYPFLVLSGLSGFVIGGVVGNPMICSTHTTHCASNLCLRLDRPESVVMPAHIACWVGTTAPQELRSSRK